jgi:hypothetical protein
MPTDNYRELLLEKADDAAERAKWAADLVVRAAWERIEASYRMTAAMIAIDDAVTARDQASSHRSATGISPRC